MQTHFVHVSAILRHDIIINTTTDVDNNINGTLDERIDGHTLRGLDESALDQFGVSSGFQQTLLDIIENLV